MGGLVGGGSAVSIGLTPIEGREEREDLLHEEAVGPQDVGLEGFESLGSHRGTEGALHLYIEGPWIGVVRLNPKAEGVLLFGVWPESQAQPHELGRAPEGVELVPESENPAAEERAGVGGRFRVNEAPEDDLLAGVHRDAPEGSRALSDFPYLGGECLVRQTAALFPELEPVGQESHLRDAAWGRHGVGEDRAEGADLEARVGGLSPLEHLIVEPLNGAGVRRHRGVKELAKESDGAGRVRHIGAPR